MLNSPVPSLSYFVNAIFLILSRHPLIVSSPVVNPYNNEPIKIEKWRFYNGHEYSNKLTCSIYAHSNLNERESLPRPDVKSVSIQYKSNEIGNQGTDLAIYSIAVKLHYLDKKIGYLSKDEDLIITPSELPIDPQQELLTSKKLKRIELHINPSSQILSDYAELVRLALLDNSFNRRGRIPINQISIPFINLKEVPWENETFLNEAEIMINIETNVSRNWAQRFERPIQNITLNLETR